MTRRTLSTTLICTLACVGVLGCDDGGAGMRYRAERDFWQTHRDAERLAVNPELVSENELLAVADRFLAVGVRYIGVVDGEEAESATNSDRSVARIGARAKILAAQYYLRGGDVESAKKTALSVREEMAWDPAASMLGQSAYIDALRREGDEEAAVAEMWRLAESYPAVADDGTEVHNSVFNAPMATVRQTLQSGGDADAEIERALDYYENVRASHPARVPALLADLHRASLYDIRGDWRRSAEVLGEVLAAYPDSVLRPAEGSRVAFTLGRLLATEERDGAGAVEAFERARALAPGSSTAWDATLALGEYHASVGDYDRAVELFEAVYEGDPDDRSRAPRAMLSHARALETAGRWDEARNAFSELQAAYPDSPQSREAPFLIAAHYRRTGEDDLADSILRRAEEDLRATIREEGTSNEGLTAYRYLFDVLIEREEWEQAAREMAAFAEVFQGRPEAALALLQAAQIARERLRDDARAVGYLERVEDGYPQTAFAERARDMRSQLTN